jgi:hypothetical protein
VMPALIAAVRARATVGEVSDALAAEWGRHDPGGGGSTRSEVTDAKFFA